MRSRRSWRGAIRSRESAGSSPWRKPYSRSRSEPAADRRVPGEVMRAALQLAAGKVSEPVALPQGIYVVKALERRAPDPAGLDKEHEELRKQVLEQKKNQAWEHWVKNLKAGAKIQMSSRPSSP